MSASIDVPVTISPEAAARIAELGMHRELQQMIEHVRQVVPELAAIEVAREPAYDMDWEPVCITAYSDRPFQVGDDTSANLIRWRVEMFPPQVLDNLCLLLSPGRPHAG